MIKDNLLEINNRIREAERKAGRKEGSVRLMAVSKFHPAEAIIPVLKLSDPIPISGLSIKL